MEPVPEEKEEGAVIGGGAARVTGHQGNCTCLFSSSKTVLFYVDNKIKYTL